jgi:hypothetical protein
MRLTTAHVQFQVKPLWPVLVAKGARLDVVAEALGCRSLPGAHAENNNPRPTFGLITFAHFAVEFFDIDLLKATIAQCADLQVRSTRFGSALCMACDSDNDEMARMLLWNGAHPDSVTQLCLVALNT